MAIYAEAVDVLIRRAQFDPEVAIGVAEAIDVTITSSQLVTVSILDARLRDLRHELKSEIQSVRAEFKADLEKTKAELVRWVFLTMLGNVALSAGISAILKTLAN